MSQSVFKARVMPVLYSRLRGPDQKPVIPYTEQQLLEMSSRHLVRARAFNLDSMATRLSAGNFAQHPYFQLEFFTLKYTTKN